MLSKGGGGARGRCRLRPSWAVRSAHPSDPSKGVLRVVKVAALLFGVHSAAPCRRRAPILLLDGLREVPPAWLRIWVLFDIAI